MIRLDVNTRFSMLDVPDEVELPIVFTAEAYRADELVDGRPCDGCSPLFVFDQSIETRTGGRNELSYSSARLAEPIQVFFRGRASGQEIFHGRSPLLFAGEEGRRSRAATGFALDLNPNEPRP